MQHARHPAHAHSPSPPPHPPPQLLLDGPTNLTGVGRHVINIKWVALTDLKVKVARNARQKTLTQAWTEAGTMDKWNATAWAKKIAAKKTKASLTDFQRFQAKNKQQKLMKAVRAKVAA
jgi:large subunit ribosomal protein L14e